MAKGSAQEKPRLQNAAHSVMLPPQSVAAFGVLWAMSIPSRLVKNSVSTV